MDQDDVEFEQLLGEIPRATSAPPQVEEHFRNPSSGLFLSPSHSHKPFIDMHKSNGLGQSSDQAYSHQNKLNYALSGQQQLLEDDHTLACTFGGLSLNSSPRELAIHAQGAMGEEKANWVVNGSSFPEESTLSLVKEYPTGQHVQKPSNGVRVSGSCPVDAYAGSLQNHHLSGNQSPPCYIHGNISPNGSASGSSFNTGVSKQPAAPDWNPFTVPYEHLIHSQFLQEQISIRRRVQEEQIQEQVYANIHTQGSVPRFTVMPVSRMHSPTASMQPPLFQPCIRLGDHNQQLLFKQQLNWDALHHHQGGQNISAPEAYHLPHVGELCCSNQGYGSLEESFSPALAHSEATLRNSNSHQLSGSLQPIKLLRQFSSCNGLHQAPIPGTRSIAVSSICKPGSTGELLYSTHQLKGSLQSAALLPVMHPESQSTCQVDGETGSAKYLNSGTSHLQQQLKYTSLEEVKGQIYAIAKDQHGCRFLQRKFDEGSVEDIKAIFSEIFEHIVELMMDPFGNYLIQKLLEVCSESQRMHFILSVTQKAELVSISLNMHGTRAVQKLIETLTTPEQVEIVIRSLQSGVVNLIKDLNGNHVVQRCLQHLSNKDSQFIFDAAASHCVEIATHRHGCCVLQRCVDYASGSQRDRLISEIAANALILSQDPYGNYVVQYVLDLNILWAGNEVMVRLGGNYPQLAMQKFSSNVVEKCLKLADEENKTWIIHELINSSSLGQLLHHEYANYVIQCALSVSKGALHTNLVEALRPHLPALRSSPYGKRILSRANLKKMQFVHA